MNNERTSDRAALAEIAATIPPHIRRLQSVEDVLSEYCRGLLQRAVDAELVLLVEIERIRREVPRG